MKIEKLSTTKSLDLTPREVILFSLSHKQKEKEKITHQTGGAGEGEGSILVLGSSKSLRSVAFCSCLQKILVELMKIFGFFFFLNVQKWAILKDLEFNWNTAC